MRQQDSMVAVKMSQETFDELIEYISAAETFYETKINFAQGNENVIETMTEKLENCRSFDRAWRGGWKW